MTIPERDCISAASNPSASTRRLGSSAVNDTSRTLPLSARAARNARCFCWFFESEASSATNSMPLETCWSSSCDASLSAWAPSNQGVLGSCK
jgi:hypothetical protein